MLVVCSCGPELLPSEADVEQRRDALTLLSVEAETWSASGVVVTDATASGGAALQIASLQRSLAPSSAGTSLTLRTRAQSGCSSASSLVAVNGVTLGTLVSGAGWATTTYTTALPPSFTLNMTYVAGCRTVIDFVSVDGPPPPPPPMVVVVEAEVATGAGTIAPPYRRFTTNGSASAPFTLPRAATQVSAPATGTRCTTSPLPRLILLVDGVQVLNQVVSTSGVTVLSTPVSIPGGAHTVTFTYDGPTTCTGSMSVDKATFTGP